MRSAFLTVGARALVAVMVSAVVLVGGSSTARADTEYRRGPDPTEASVSAEVGPFATASTSVAASAVTGFGGGIIDYPTDTSQGTFGGVAFAPGYMASAKNYTWVGPRIASQGFVVFVIDTLARTDGPSQRAKQLLAALDYLITDSPVQTRIDPDRLAVAGHSMGGGGTIEAANDRPGLQAAVALEPWHTNKSWPRVRVPTLIVGAEADTTAPPATYAEPIYESIPAASEKAYLELNDADHQVGTRSDPTQAKFAIVWLKRYVDNDTRYEQFLCPNPGPSAAIEEYRDTCPA